MQISGRKALQAEETASAKAPGQGVFEDQPGSQYGQSSIIEGEVLGPENAVSWAIIRRLLLLCMRWGDTCMVLSTGGT